MEIKEPLPDMTFQVGDVFVLDPPMPGENARSQNSERVVSDIFLMGYSSDPTNYWMWWKSKTRNSGGVSDYRNALRRWKVVSRVLTTKL